MCRSIKTLRPPWTEDVSDADMHAAALQYVRKVVGMRRPAPHNQEAFDAAVATVSQATQALLRDVHVRGSGQRVRPSTPATTVSSRSAATSARSAATSAASAET